MIIISYEKLLKDIKPLNKEAMKEASAKLDSLAKPIGSLGKLEDLAIQVAGITGQIKNEFTKKCTVVMCADNGVWEEGVSSCPQYITTTQTINFTKGLTGISVLCRQASMDVKIVDIGINSNVESSLILNRKIRKGTSNMAKGPAMTREEAIRAIEVGIEVVKELKLQGYKVLGTGEMGIGNTSTSSAILMALTGCDVNIAVGKGAGLTEEGYENKKRIIKQAIEINNLSKDDPLEVLHKVGGFDIAGLVGCYIGAAYYRVPIIIDGFISASAALVASRMNPLIKEHMIPSHASAEPGFTLIMEELGLKPLLNLNMRLGEGTGCPLAVNLLEAANRIICEMATFEEAEIKDDYLIDIR